VRAGPLFKDLTMTPFRLRPTRRLVTCTTLAIATVLVCNQAAAAAEQVCATSSGPGLTPVIELYTSEGCSSCPPADQWLSSLKAAAAQGRVVVQAFHVGYWDNLGWVDRFASPAFTGRQRELAALNGLHGIYTPQVVRNGTDWPDWRTRPGDAGVAGANLAIRRLGANQFEATVTPAPGASTGWSAYWTVTEGEHRSRVKSGENAGEVLKHDFVVRQYTPAGSYKGPARLSLSTIGADPQHPRQVNLVVYDPRTAKPLQSLSLQCPA
jgi:hypothetical protein